ncbi:MAG TPA: M48 family metalloprotease [Caulobacteraceae bacterium]|nr:M48 family metalloprotease [Caulobacteraceae bacterium]
MNVQAATDAWLARLPAPERLAAQAATDARLAGWVAGVVIFVAIAALLTRLGVASRLARSIEAGGPRPWLATGAAAAVTALMLASAKAIVDATVTWRVGQVMGGGGGAGAPSLPADLATAAAGVLPIVVVAALVFPPLAWLMRRAPRRWPLILGPAALALVLGLGWLPYALSAGPAGPAAPPGPAQAGVARLVAETGLPVPVVQQAADPALDADVTGGFGHARVVVGPRLLAGDPGEARAYVGHLIGHYAHNDVLIVCLVVGAVVWAGCWAAQGWAAPLARAMGAKEARGPADPATTPALAVIAAATVTLAALVGAAYLRWANVGADSYSLAHAREPDGLVAVIEDEWRRDPAHDSVTPSALETALFYSHPPLATRIAHAMAWKSAPPG